MSSESEQSMKRFKPNDITIELNIDTLIQKLRNSEKSLKAVMVEDIYKSIPLVNVYIGCLKDVKDISKTILLLNEKLPLKDLQHLKRAKCKDIIICRTQSIKTLSIQEYIETHVEELKTIFQSFQEIEVPSLPPKVKKQYQEANALWPCNFHPNLYLEKLVNNVFFSSDQLSQHKRYMQVVFEVAKCFFEKESLKASVKDNILKNTNASVIVDPDSKSIVAVSFDNRRNHPIQHSVMLAIDNVAKTQNGGVWSSGVHDSTLTTGIDVQVLPYLKEKFPEINFGHKQYIKQSDCGNGKEGPYLCTGYYVYLLREPCFMCAMALVHARAKCVFFCLDNLEDGALKSRTQLQAIPSLNHHFEVFTDFL